MADYDVMILGAGSVGCVIGGYLASTGASVLLVNRRADTMVAVAEKGLRLETEAGMMHTTLMPVWQQMHGLPELLCVLPKLLIPNRR